MRSGRRVVEELGARGVDATWCEPGPDLAASLRERPVSCVIPMMHGAGGEDGELQSLLEVCGVPYTGSDPVAARMSFDKPVAKRVLAADGIDTPAAMLVSAELIQLAGQGPVAQRILDRLGTPVMVKPVRGGSALGCSVATTADDLAEALTSSLAYGPVALAEEFVAGVEISVAVLAGADGDRALPAVQIRPDGGYYDYAARYTAGATEFIVPADVSAAVATRCADVATAAHRRLGLRDLSRCDLIVDTADRVWFLEANITPGMTDTSVVPLALEADGRSVGEAFTGLVRAAIARAAIARAADR